MPTGKQRRQAERRRLRRQAQRRQQQQSRRRRLNPGVRRRHPARSSTSIFGVTSGLGVVGKVSAGGTANGSTDGPPKLPLTFRTVRVG